MKQSALLRWIEAAEARSVCLIAEEDPARASIDATPTSPQGFNLLLGELMGTAVSIRRDPAHLSI